MIRAPHKGFTLLISIVLAAVALSIGLALLDIAYKQVILASSGKQSQYAFYAADAVLECALYYDQKGNAFDYNSPNAAITCNNLGATGYTTGIGVVNGVNTRTTTFFVPCVANSAVLVQGQVTVYKAQTTNATQIFSTGYNLCDSSNPRRIERGLKVTY